MLKVKTQDSAFVAQLKRGNSKIRTDRAVRIGNKVANAHSRMVMDLEEKVANKEDELEAMMDLSTDNQTTSLNVVSPDFDASKFVERVNILKTDIRLLKINLEIAQETTKEWFE